MDQNTNPSMETFLQAIPDRMTLEVDCAKSEDWREIDNGLEHVRGTVVPVDCPDHKSQPKAHTELTTA